MRAALPGFGFGRIAVMLTLCAAFCCLASTQAAFAADCTVCHRPGIAPDGSVHPVPSLGGWISAWDPSDGQCTVCHEIPDEILIGYQNPPHGAYFLTLAASGGDHYWIIDTQCRDCHGASTNRAHAISYPMPATIDIAGTDCAGCHTSGMSENEAWPSYPADAVPQIDPGSHSDLASYHATAVTASCLSCHSADLTAVHADCATCHGSVPVAGQTCITCHPDYDQPHGVLMFDGPFNPGYAPVTDEPVGDGFPGYLRWRNNSPGAQGWSADGSTSPHGNYITTTNKCAVCHSVHQADPTGTVLTAWGGQSTVSSCSFCHSDAATFTPVRVLTMADGTIDPHSTCTDGCHVASPHGAGASEYPVLQSALLQARADDSIAADWGAPGVAMFEAGSADGRVLGTGYLCSDGGGCHAQSAFAVHEAGYQPGGLTVTGHRVVATATPDWNAGGEFDAAYTGQIAWNSADSCRACHDATTYWGGPAFPHNYVNPDGDPVAKWDTRPAGSGETSSSFVWLTYAANAGDAKTVLEGSRHYGDTGSTESTPAAELLTRDGLCLKCHVGTTGDTGVGFSY